MHLLTGKHINIYHWEEIFIDDKVIMKTEELPEKHKNQL